MYSLKTERLSTWLQNYNKSPVGQWETQKYVSVAIDNRYNSNCWKTTACLHRASRPIEVSRKLCLQSNIKLATGKTSRRASQLRLSNLLILHNLHAKIFEGPPCTHCNLGHVSSHRPMFYVHLVHIYWLISQHAIYHRWRASGTKHGVTSRISRSPFNIQCTVATR